MSIGTSLPELATSIQAVRRGQSDIAVANVVGSNIFNVFCIVGISGLIIPLPVHEAMPGWDYLWMIAFSLLLFIPILTGKSMGRRFGACLVLGLTIYTYLLLAYPQLGS
jgi:cation:H+ antiporter